MILVLGSSRDKVYPRLMECLRESGHPFAVVDEDSPGDYAVRCEEEAEGCRFRVEGGGLDGTRPVNSIFVRHAVARKIDPLHLQRMGALQTALNHMLLLAACPVLNPPANAYSNYAKPYQVGLLADAGFDVPRSLVTNLPAEVERFYEECGGRVIFKGVSNVMTLAQVMRPRDFERLGLLPHSPTLFQEYVEGVDYRAHVIGDEVFVTRLVTRNEDYRRSSLTEEEEIVAEPAVLPPEVAERCVAFTRRLGLVAGGIDFKESAAGRLVALELNPYPQFTFYEGRSGQPITKAVVDYLIQHQVTETNVFA